MIYSLDLDTHSPTYISNHHSGHSKYIRLYLSIKLRGEKDKSGIFMVLAPHHSTYSRAVFKWSNIHKYATQGDCASARN